MSETESSPAATVPCWRRIGVWGRQRPRCAELETVIHCRNCPVYAEAARRRLEVIGGDQRPLEPLDEPPPQRRTALVIFRVSGQWLALPAGLMEQVAPRTLVRPLPHKADTVVRGLVTVGGELLPCVSLSRLLGIERDRSGRDDVARGVFERLVVIHGEGLRVAFRVGEIRGVYHYQDDEVSAVSDGLPDGVRAYVDASVSATLRSAEVVSCGRLAPQRLLADLKDAIR